MKRIDTRNTKNQNNIESQTRKYTDIRLHIKINSKSGERFLKSLLCGFELLEKKENK